MSRSAPCPCGGAAYATCCEPLHDGAGDAQTCEQLMRARYSAYAVQKLNYVFRTWHPKTRPESIEPTTSLQWRGLTIVDLLGGERDDEVGVVEFEAAYTDNGREAVMRERSRFERRRGQWVYVDAE